MASPLNHEDKLHRQEDAYQLDAFPKLRHCSAESIRFLRDGQVDLIVTSPPYWNARAYKEWTPKRGTKPHKKRDYRQGFGEGSYEEYLALMTRCFAEAYRVLKPGGICCVNISAVLYKTRMYPIPADLTKRLIEIGFEMKEELIWDKTHSACDRFGNFAKYPYPHNFYPNLCTERVLILRKPGPRASKAVDPDDREASRLPLTKLAKTEICNDIWHIASARHGEVQHCAPFPQDLVARLILLYSHKNELVLDPFMGSGQTMVVAHGYGRRFVGVDVEEKFVDYAKSRIGEPMKIRSKQLVPRYERVEGDAFLESNPDRSGRVTTSTLHHRPHTQ